MSTTIHPYVKEFVAWDRILTTGLRNLFLHTENWQALRQLDRLSDRGLTRREFRAALAEMRTLVGKQGGSAAALALLGIMKIRLRLASLGKNFRVRFTSNDHNNILVAARAALWDAVPSLKDVSRYGSLMEKGSAVLMTGPVPVIPPLTYDDLGFEPPVTQDDSKARSKRNKLTDFRAGDIFCLQGGNYAQVVSQRPKVKNRNPFLPDHEARVSLRIGAVLGKEERFGSQLDPYHITVVAQPAKSITVKRSTFVEMLSNATPYQPGLGKAPSAQQTQQAVQSVKQTSAADVARRLDDIPSPETPKPGSIVSSYGGKSVILEPDTLTPDENDLSLLNEDQ